MSEDGKVILFPQNRIVKRHSGEEQRERDTKFSRQIQKQQTIQFVEQAVDEIALDLLRKCVDLAMKTQTQTFTRDFAYLVDALRSMVKRDFELNHVVQKIVDKTVTLKQTTKGETVANIDYSKIYDTKSKTIRSLSEDVQDELDGGGIEFIPDFDPPKNDN